MLAHNNTASWLHNCTSCAICWGLSVSACSVCTVTSFSSSYHAWNLKSSQIFTDLSNKWWVSACKSNFADSICVPPAAVSASRSYRAIVFADVWSDSWQVERNAITDTHRYTEFLFLLGQCAINTTSHTTCCSEIIPKSINLIWITCCSMHVLNKQPTLYPGPDTPWALYFDR